MIALINEYSQGRMLTKEVSEYVTSSLLTKRAMFVSKYLSMFFADMIHLLLGEMLRNDYYDYDDEHRHYQPHAGLASWTYCHIPSKTSFQLDGRGM